MGLLDKALIPQAAGPYPADHDFWYNPVGPMSLAGVRMNADVALTISTVYRCIKAVGGDVAALPLKMFRVSGRGREEARNHPLWDVLHSRPNEWQTSYEWREMMMGHLLLRGNAYSLIVPGERGFADQLIPLHPGNERIKVEQLENRRLRYTYVLDNGRSVVYSQDEIFHLRNLGVDGIVGLSTVNLAANSFGLGLATEQYGARFFANDARPGGILTTDHALSDEARQRNLAGWKEAHQGILDSHKVAVLEGGLKWQSVGMSSEDAQFLETRAFQVEEIARWFGVPLHRIGHTEKATSWGTGIEQFNLGYVVQTLIPHIVAWEQAISKDLILAPQTFFAKFLVQGLLRGDSAARSAFYRELVMMGAMSPNEVRESEDMNPVEGLDFFLVPQNMSMVDGGGRVRPINDLGLSDIDDRARVLAYEAASRVIRKEATAVEKAIKRFGDDKEGLQAWADEFYARHAEFIAEVLHIPLSAAEKYLENRKDVVSGARDLMIEDTTHLANLALKGEDTRDANTNDKDRP